MLNIGIVGCGYWGPNLIRNFNYLSDCNVKWLCDVDVGRLALMVLLYRELLALDGFTFFQEREYDQFPVGIERSPLLKRENPVP